MRHRAFTLVEILVVVAIAGIIIIAALAPLTFTIRTISRAQKNFSVSNRERFVINRIFADAAEALSIQCEAPFRLIRHDELGSAADDTLLLWTKTPSYTGEAMACVAYRMLPDSILGREMPDGLYRWVLSADAQPGDIEEGDLRREDGKLVLGGLIGARFSVLKDGEWVGEYSGGIPQAIRVTLQKEEGEVAYESQLPKF